MKQCLFISRHEPTQEQIALAGKLGFELVLFGDWDAFTPFKEPNYTYEAVCVVQPFLLTNFLDKILVSFKNENRDGVFATTEVYTYDFTTGEKQHGRL